LKLTFLQISPSSTIGTYLPVLHSLTVIETVGKLVISVSCLCNENWNYYWRTKL